VDRERSSRNTKDTKTTKNIAKRRISKWDLGCRIGYGEVVAGPCPLDTGVTTAVRAPALMPRPLFIAMVFATIFVVFVSFVFQTRPPRTTIVNT
jgi:hypothetical protein